MTRNETRSIRVGTLSIGGDAPVTVQTMCNTKTWDVEATVAQIRAMRSAGADIVRLAVPDEQSALAIDKIKEQVDVPLVADIHFDYRLALMCAERGIDKIRINPGNTRRLRTPAGSVIFRSASGSTPALWRNACLKNTGIPARRPWWRVPGDMWTCFSRTILRISACP